MRLFLFMLLFLGLSAVHAEETFKVGIYNNAPKIFIDENNQPAGFFVDLLNAIAKEAHYKLEYVPCVWEECLIKLQSNEIDVMPDVAYSKERHSYLDFSNEVVLSSWSVIYTNPNVTIVSMLDLDHKKIAVLRNSIQLQHLKEHSKLFNITPIFEEVEDLAETLSLLNAHKVDAAVVNNFYHISPTRFPNIQKTNIFLNPVTLNFAFPQKASNPLKKTLDGYLKAYKTDKSSPYHQAQKRWLEQEKQSPLPQWVWWVINIGIAGLLLLFITTFLFKYLLHKKVKELEEHQKILLAQSRSAAMGEMLNMIAHQWKQPLTTLSMINNNLKVDAELGEINETTLNDFYTQFSKQIEYLSQTITDFSNFFKPNKEKENVEELSLVIEKALVLMEKTLENNRIVINKEYAHTNALMLYPNELIQVLMSLLKNAQEAFTQQHTPSPLITLRCYQKENWAVIEIEDNAGGIKEELRDKIFDAYFTTKESYNGTGLGLYMCKSIIENHFKGTITLTCKDGHSTFRLTFQG